MRVVVIGGSGHVGTYLIPRLVEWGHEVINISRGQRQPYHADGAWAQVRGVGLDRVAEERQGTFAQKVLDLKPDIVVDMICFEPESCRHLVEALKGQVQHYLLTGTMWVHGHGVQVPYTEEEAREPFGDYGVKKAAIEAYLLDQARRYGFPATIVHPGHIVGPGWPPIGPQGNVNLAIFERLARGDEVLLPDMGLGQLHHVHASDVAQIYWRSIANWGASVGEAFHAVSPAALTLRGYCEAVAGWFGQKASLRYLPFAEWRTHVTEREANLTYDHIAHSPSGSTEKARRALGYVPRYTSLEAIREALAWLIANGRVQAPPLG